VLVVNGLVKRFGASRGQQRVVQVEQGEILGLIARTVWQEHDLHMLSGSWYHRRLDRI